MQTCIRWFEKLIVSMLVVLLMVVILLSTIELGWLIIQDILKSAYFMPSVADLLDIFGFFLLVLIGIELLVMLKAYLEDQAFHIELVLQVALIAVARKAIVLNIEKLSSLTILGIATLILALAIAYHLYWRGRKS